MMFQSISSLHLFDEATFDNEQPITNPLQTRENYRQVYSPDDRLRFYFICNTRPCYLRVQQCSSNWLDTTQPITQRNEAAPKMAWGLYALLACVARYNAETELIDIHESTSLITEEQLFSWYYQRDLEDYRRENKGKYDSFGAHGMADKVKELDETFLQQHIDQERQCKQRTEAITDGNIDATYFGGHLQVIVERYLAWVLQRLNTSTLDNQQETAPANTKASTAIPKSQKAQSTQGNESLNLTGYRTKLNICVKNRWLVKDGKEYRRAQGVSDNVLAFILGVIWGGDSITNGRITKGSSDFPAGKLENYFSVKTLSDKRSKLSTLKKTQKYKEIHDSLNI